MGADNLSESSDVRVTTWRVSGEELRAVSLPMGSTGGLSSLTAAERDIVLALLSGRSNRQIAARRGTCIGTVSKQLSAIYRKLGAQSRYEVVAAVFGVSDQP